MSGFFDEEDLYTYEPVQEQQNNTASSFFDEEDLYKPSVKASAPAVNTTAVKSTNTSAPAVNTTVKPIAKKTAKARQPVINEGVIETGIKKYTPIGGIRAGLGRIGSTAGNAAKNLWDNKWEIAKGLAKGLITDPGKALLNNPLKDSLGAAARGAGFGTMEIPQDIVNTGIAAANTYAGKEVFKPWDYMDTVKANADAFYEGTPLGRNEAVEPIQTLGEFAGIGGGVNAGVKGIKALNALSKTAGKTKRLNEVSKAMKLAEQGDVKGIKDLAEIVDKSVKPAETFDKAAKSGKFVKNLKHSIADGAVIGGLSGARSGDLEEILENAGAGAILGGVINPVFAGIEAAGKGIANTKPVKAVTSNAADLISGSNALANKAASTANALGLTLEGRIADYQMMQRLANEYPSIKDHNELLARFNALTNEEKQQVFDILQYGDKEALRQQEIARMEAEAREAKRIAEENYIKEKAKEKKQEKKEKQEQKQEEQKQEIKDSLVKLVNDLQRGEEVKSELELSGKEKNKPNQFDIAPDKKDKSLQPEYSEQLKFDDLTIEDLAKLGAEGIPVVKRGIQPENKQELPFTIPEGTAVVKREIRVKQPSRTVEETPEQGTLEQEQAVNTGAENTYSLPRSDYNNLNILNRPAKSKRVIKDNPNYEENYDDFRVTRLEKGQAEGADTLQRTEQSAAARTPEAEYEGNAIDEYNDLGISKRGKTSEEYPRYDADKSPEFIEFWETYKNTDKRGRARLFNQVIKALKGNKDGLRQFVRDVQEQIEKDIDSAEYDKITDPNAKSPVDLADNKLLNNMLKRNNIDIDKIDLEATKGQKWAASSEWKKILGIDTPANKNKIVSENTLYGILNQFKNIDDAVKRYGQLADKIEKAETSYAVKRAMFTDLNNAFNRKLAAEKKLGKAGNAGKAKRITKAEKRAVMLNKLEEAINNAKAGKGSIDKVFDIINDNKLKYAKYNSERVNDLLIDAYGLKYNQIMDEIDFHLNPDEVIKAERAKADKSISPEERHKYIDEHKQEIINEHRAAAQRIRKKYQGLIDTYNTDFSTGERTEWNENTNRFEGTGDTWDRTSSGVRTQRDIVNEELDKKLGEDISSKLEYSRFAKADRHFTSHKVKDFADEIADDNSTVKEYIKKYVGDEQRFEFDELSDGTRGRTDVKTGNFTINSNKPLETQMGTAKHETAHVLQKTIAEACEKNSVERKIYADGLRANRNAHRFEKHNPEAVKQWNKFQQLVKKSKAKAKEYLDTLDFVEKLKVKEYDKLYRGYYNAQIEAEARAASEGNWKFFGKDIKRYERNLERVHKGRTGGLEQGRPKNNKGYDDGRTKGISGRQRSNVQNDGTYSDVQRTNIGHNTVRDGGYTQTQEQAKKLNSNEHIDSKEYDYNQPSKFYNKISDKVRNLSAGFAELSKLGEKAAIETELVVDEQASNRIKQQDGTGQGYYHKRVGDGSKNEPKPSLKEKMKRLAGKLTRGKIGLAQYKDNSNKAGTFGQKIIDNLKKRFDFNDSAAASVQDSMNKVHHLNVMNFIKDKFAEPVNNGHVKKGYIGIKYNVFSNAVYNKFSKAWYDNMCEGTEESITRASRNAKDAEIWKEKFLNNDKYDFQIPEEVFNEVMKETGETPKEYWDKYVKGTKLGKRTGTGVLKVLGGIQDAMNSVWKRGVLSRASFFLNNRVGNQQQLASGAENAIDYVKSWYDAVKWTSGKEVKELKKQGRQIVPEELAGNIIAEAASDFQTKRQFTGIVAIDNFFNLCNGHFIDLKALKTKVPESAEINGIKTFRNKYSHNLKSVAAAGLNLCMGLPNAAFAKLSDAMMKINESAEGQANPINIPQTEEEIAAAAREGTFNTYNDPQEQAKNSIKQNLMSMIRDKISSCFKKS